MKYVVTGSLGNISKPLAERLIAAGHEVTVMSSNPEKAAEIEKLGAEIEAFDFASSDTKAHERFALISGQKEKAEEDLLGLYEELEVLQSKS